MIISNSEISTKNESVKNNNTTNIFNTSIYTNLNHEINLELICELMKTELFTKGNEHRRNNMQYKRELLFQQIGQEHIKTIFNRNYTTI